MTKYSAQLALGVTKAHSEIPRGIPLHTLVEWKQIIAQRCSRWRYRIQLQKRGTYRWGSMSIRKLVDEYSWSFTYLCAVLKEIRERHRESFADLFEVDAIKVRPTFCCPICRESDSDTHPVMEALCNHQYHVGCMWANLQSGNLKCCMCRKMLPHASNWCNPADMQIRGHPGMVYEVKVLFNAAFPPHTLANED
jgi:hypothetical protein